MLKKVFLGILAGFILSSCGKQITNHSSIQFKSSGVVIEGLKWVNIHSQNQLGPLIYQNALAVGLLTHQNPKIQCQGTAIGDNVILTSFHCLPNTTNFKFTLTMGLEKSGSPIDYICTEFVLGDEKLDFAIIRCEGNPGKEFGQIELSQAAIDFQLNDKIYTIHHNCFTSKNNMCSPLKKVSPGFIRKLGEDQLGHDSDTLNGSSGAPVFSALTHELIGIHSSGLINDKTGLGEMNYLIKITSILESLPFK